jgi:thioredoxin-dependent peroxiredoxin
VRDKPSFFSADDHRPPLFNELLFEMNFLDWLGLTHARKPLEVGDTAPDVLVRDERGNALHLTDLCGSGFTLVYFYPRADTPGCTAQACSLRDGFADLQERGVRAIGVSADPPDAQLRFKEKYHLPFTLLADTDYLVASAFGVRLLFGMTSRQSFLIKSGRIVWRDLSASTREQAQDVIKALEKLGGDSPPS